MARVRVAHVSGPTATIQNTPPLVTASRTRTEGAEAASGRGAGAFDALRPQRLGRPAVVYVEQFSAHPLEAEYAHLYAPPDGYIGADGEFRTQRATPEDVPVYRIELRPEDGLYPMPYMGRQRNGAPWEQEGTGPGAERGSTRQTFLADGRRAFEEIDRLCIGADGRANVISSLADVDFLRSLPPGGPVSGRDGPAEQAGRDFFGYSPYHLGTVPPRPALATLTNDLQEIASSDIYDGIIFTQGSPQIEETAYWLQLLMEHDRPICCIAAQRRHGQTSADGPQNIVDAIRFIASDQWRNEDGRNRCGVVALQDQQIFAARELYKADARPGGYRATGGHGGILGQVTQRGRVKLTYLPAFRHTWNSELRLAQLPVETFRAERRPDGVRAVPITVKSGDGTLLPGAIPAVAIVKDGGFGMDDFDSRPEDELDLIALIDRCLTSGRLAGLVVEGLVPFGRLPSPPREALLRRAVASGLPVVRVGRGTPEGFADVPAPMISGANLTAVKARILLMAALMKFGCLPPAANADNPDDEEMGRLEQAVACYQSVFDTH